MRRYVMMNKNRDINPRLNRLDSIYQALAPKIKEPEQKNLRRLPKGVQKNTASKGRVFWICTIPMADKIL